MRQRKTHIKIKGRPACGVTRYTVLNYAKEAGSATCGNCRRVVAK